ncbi:hypothetical protein BJY01DRAFT_255594 [Aspergillus pseudoustus]|uniref:Uncharacterized protein n=1 Tax=Aspergillus pseudoustus TaxID=1810923 RepID=A0ABR4IIT1_9EURO
MAVSDDGVPLYMESVKRILREMRLVQRASEESSASTGGGGGGFDYREFRRRIDGCGLTPGQMAPLAQRLDSRESFMPAFQTEPAPWSRSAKIGLGSRRERGTDWTAVVSAFLQSDPLFVSPSGEEPGRLTIVDLSRPCISPATACLLFNNCLTIFLQPHADDAEVGRIVVLGTQVHDRNTRISRLHRNAPAGRPATVQEPTVSTRLLDLCSVTIVRGFTSPGWMKVLQGHLAAAAAIN